MAASCGIGPLCWVKSVAGITFSTFISGAASWVAASADWAWHALGAFLGATSDPSVVIKAANGEYGSLVALAPLVALLAFIANVMSSLRRVDPAALVRDTLVAAPLIILGVLSARPLAQLILVAVDAMCAGASSHASATLSTLTAQASTLPTGVPQFADLLLAIGEVVGAVLLWFELIVRNAILALLLALSPIVFAAGLWTPLRKLSVRLIETFVAIALSKFVIVVALALGVQSTQSNSVLVIITGVAVCLLAVLAPFSLLRVVPLLEVSALHAMEGIRQRASSAVTRGAKRAGTAAMNLAPEKIPGIPEVGEDLGIPMWEGEGELEFPARGGPTPEPPIGDPLVRHGQPAFYHDEYGPVMGWHFDE
jgi:hypothetical protein